jgi:hypothetical protein
MNHLAVNSSFRLLISSILISLVLSSCNVSRKYREEASKNWGKDILRFEQMDKIEKDPQNAIFFVGSSSIRLWSTLKEDVAPYPVIQRGFGGSKFSDLSVYAKKIVYPHEFHTLVIFEANDITGSNTDKSPEEVVKLFRNIVRTVRKKYTDQPIFVLGITPTKSRWGVWPTVKRTNQLLKETCANLSNTYFIETAAAYLDKDGEPKNDLFQGDMLHQNHEGYIIWGDLVKNKLDEVLAKKIKQ